MVTDIGAGKLVIENKIYKCSHISQAKKNIKLPDCLIDINSSINSSSPHILFTLCLYFRVLIHSLTLTAGPWFTCAYC